jgi:hypothetical protein
MDARHRRNKMAEIVRNHGYESLVTEYCHSSDHMYWHCKTDSSASIELATSILSGWKDLKKSTEIVQSLKDNHFWFNHKCGFHVHVNIEDFSREERIKLLRWWVKFENFILNMFPVERRLNHFCKMYNQNDHLVANFLNYGTSSDRYVSLNIQNNTAEFRFGNMSDDSEEIKNRIRFFIWIIDCIKTLYTPDTNSWNSPAQIMNLLGLNIKSNKYLNVSYSPNVNNMRIWALKSYLKNCVKYLYVKNITQCEQMLKEFESSN